MRLHVLHLVIWQFPQTRNSLDYKQDVSPTPQTAANNSSTVWCTDTAKMCSSVTSARYDSLSASIASICLYALYPAYFHALCFFQWGICLFRLKTPQIPTVSSSYQAVKCWNLEPWTSPTWELRVVPRWPSKNASCTGTLLMAWFVCSIRFNTAVEFCFPHV